MRQIWGRALTVLVMSVGAALAIAPAAGATGFRATFDSGPQGFQDGILGGSADWAPVGGHPGGHIGDSFANEGLAAVTSADSWAGDHIEAFGGIVAFDLRVDTGQTGSVRLRLDCTDACSEEESTVFFQFPAQVTGSWRRFSAPLRAPGWTLGGMTDPPASQFAFVDVIRHFESLTIVVSDIDAGDTAYVDNVTFASNVKRRLSLGYSGVKFKGKLSPTGACATQQKVVVYRKKRGADTKVGKDKTNARGRYAVREPGARAGAYYAKAAASFKSGAGNCLAARSKSERVG